MRVSGARRAAKIFSQAVRAQGPEARATSSKKFYIFPRGDYSSCIWIFRVFLPYKRVFFKQAQNAGEIFHITRKVMFGYGKRWRTLNSFYIDCMRRIIGVNDESPSSVAVLVRMGIMPLQYEFVYRAVLWYIKIARGETDQLLTDQLDTFSSDDSTFSMTCFYQHCGNYINRRMVLLTSLRKMIL